MLLWELFEELNPSDIKDVESKLNRRVYMPTPAVRAGGPVLKLSLPTNQHFGDRAAGDRGYDQNYTTGELEDLLTRARTDPSLGYANWIAQNAAWPGPGDLDPNHHGYKIKDPQTGLMIPFVVKPNPKAKKLISKTTVATDSGIEPRNIFRAKTIMRKAPGADDPMRAARLAGMQLRKPVRRPQQNLNTEIGYFGSQRRTRPIPSFKDIDEME